MTITEARARVLIVDDDFSLRLLVRAAVESGGFDATDVDTGAAALDAFKDQRPDLVLLDVVMPGIDGYETCRRIRAMPAGRTTPIVMMTGLDDVASIEQAYQAGATDFTTKPINGALLVHRLKYILRASDDARLATESAKRLAQAQRLARLVHWEYCPTSQQLRWSEEASEVFGLPLDRSYEVKDFLRWVHPDDRSIVLGELNADTPDEIEYRLTTKHGAELTIHQGAELIRDPLTGRQRLIGAAQDVTQRRQAEQRANHLAYYDSLTGLPNRALLHRYVEAVVATAQRHTHPMAVLVIDLDRFKQVNDMHGHATGDALLSQAANRIANCLRTDDFTFRIKTGIDDSFAVGESLAARLGGDEFVVVLPRLQAPEDAAVVARRILDSLAAPYSLDNTELQISASIGIAACPENGTDSDSLFRCADAAMYHAKDTGRGNYQFFTPRMYEQSQRRTEIEDGLRRALTKSLTGDGHQTGSERRDGLYLHFQPKVAVSTHQIVGVEALVRWESPTLGAVTPTEFIPIAEDTGLILALGDWIMYQACSVLQTLTKAGLQVPLAINISARQFLDPKFATRVRDILAKTGVPPRLLELELTEGVVMQDTRQSHQILAELKRLGLRVAIDDFGTGYSSLSYLTRFPFDTLKIDRSFIQLIGEQRNDAIISAIIALSHSLGLDIVAEGVEDKEQLDFLSTQGELDIQGFYFAKPMPATELSAWILDHEPPSADADRVPQIG